MLLNWKGNVRYFFQQMVSIIFLKNEFHPPVKGKGKKGVGVF